VKHASHQLDPASLSSISFFTPRLLPSLLSLSLQRLTDRLASERLEQPLPLLPRIKRPPLRPPTVHPFADAFEGEGGMDPAEEAVVVVGDEERGEEGEDGLKGGFA
jgi:hypothetical protein